MSPFPPFTVVGHLAIFAGAQSKSPGPDFGSSDAVDIFDADTGCWSTARLSQPRAGLMATTVGDEALFAGGTLDGYGSEQYSAVVDVYDAATGRWSVGPPLGSARQLGAAVTAGKTAMFAWRDPGEDNTIDFYSVR